MSFNIRNFHQDFSRKQPEYAQAEITAKTLTKALPSADSDDQAAGNPYHAARTAD
jgi:hypothetical protein